MELIKYLEFVQADFEPIKSFHLKDELNPKIWDGFKIDEEVREQLLKIAKDFYDSTDLKAEIIDIVLTGSLSNYNWSDKYSDYDLHTIIDYEDIHDDVDLVKKFCDYAKGQWNLIYDIHIKGYEIECYIQNEDDLKDSIKSGKMGGVFSLLNNKWIKKPVKVEFELDENLIREKAETLMFSIDDLEKSIDSSTSHEEFKEKLKKVWEKIKKYRKEGLETEGGELSTGNLVFKLLRRNGYIKTLLDLKVKSYEKQFK